MPCAWTQLRPFWEGHGLGATRHLPLGQTPGPSPCPPAVALPPEKAEAREGPGQLFCVDDGERVAGREGARGLGKRRLNVDVGLRPPLDALTRGPHGSRGGRLCWVEGSPRTWPEPAAVALHNPWDFPGLQCQSCGNDPEARSCTDRPVSLPGQEGRGLVPGGRGRVGGPARGRG